MYNFYLQLKLVNDIIILLFPSHLVFHNNLHIPLVYINVIYNCHYLLTLLEGTYVIENTEIEGNISLLNKKIESEKYQ